MLQLSRPRIFLGGLIAGMVIDSIQYLVDSFVFEDNWGAFSTAISPVVHFMVDASLVLGLLQIVGLFAGILAVRRYGTTAGIQSTRTSLAVKSAAYGWVLTYAPVWAALYLFAVRPKPPSMTVFHWITFAISGFAGCIAGASIGNWVYDEAEQAALRATTRA